MSLLTAEEELWQSCLSNDPLTSLRLLSSSSLNFSWIGPERGDACFNRACRLGRLEIVRQFLEAARANPRIDLNQTNEGGGTGFSLACQEGHVELVNLLLKDDRIDLNLPTKKNATPFLIACQNGHTEIVATLLADPRIDVIKSNLSRATPFFKACANGNLEVVQLLLADRRVELNIPDTEGCSPLWFAAHEGFLHVVHLIIASGRYINTQLRSNHPNDNWGNLTAAGIARLSIRRMKYLNETDEEFRRSKENSAPIANLLDSFDENPDLVRWQVRNLPGIRDPFVAEVFATMILLADEYFVMRPGRDCQGPEASGSADNRRVTRSMAAKKQLEESPDLEQEEQTKRFLKISLSLPFDLKMVLSNRMFSSPKDVVLKKTSEGAFRKIFQEM